MGWFRQSDPLPAAPDTTAELLEALVVLTRRYDVPLEVQRKWKRQVGSAGIGTITAVISTALAILEVSIARQER